MIRNKGFTLAELLLAAVILSFVLSGLLLLFTNCFLLNESSRNLSVATSHAEYIMEEIRSASFTGLEARINAAGANGWDLDTAQLQGVPYSFSTLSNESVSTAVFQSGNPLGVSVTLNWQDRGAKDRSTELRTYLTDY